MTENITPKNKESAGSFICLPPKNEHKRINTQFEEGLRCSFAMPNPFVLTNKICLNQRTIFLYSNYTLKYIKPKN